MNENGKLFLNKNLCNFPLGKLLAAVLFLSEPCVFLCNYVPVTYQTI